MPGRTPISSAASASLWDVVAAVSITSSDASWNVPTRDRSPLPMTMPSASVMMMFSPMIALVSPAISCASAGLRTADGSGALGAAMYEAY